MKFICDDGAIDKLGQDVQMSLSLLDENDSQFHRRNYVRALFSFLEGITFLTRQMIIELDRERFQDTGHLDYEKHLLLHEKLPSIGNNGTIKTSKHRVSSVDQLAFTLKSMSELFKYDGDILSDNGWEDLKKAYEIRHRINHPKTIESITITDEDLNICTNGHKWFTTLISKMNKHQWNRYQSNRE